MTKILLNFKVSKRQEVFRKKSLHLFTKFRCLLIIFFSQRLSNRSKELIGFRIHIFFEGTS